MTGQALLLILHHFQVRALLAVLCDPWLWEVQGALSNNLGWVGAAGHPLDSNSLGSLLEGSLSLRVEGTNILPP